MFVVIDYDMGNLKSMSNALKALGIAHEVSGDPAVVSRATAIILPGVGAFGDGMRALERRGLVDALREQVVERRTPYLGVCLGMQFLATRSFEHGEHAGFDWIAGDVERLTPGDASLKVPHMGWNELEIVDAASPLVRDVTPGTAVYFLHGYHFVACRYIRPVCRRDDRAWHARCSRRSARTYFRRAVPPGEKSGRRSRDASRTLPITPARMLKKRLIPSLLVRDGRIVQSVQFRHTNVIGNVITAVDFFNGWAVDEILILDVSREHTGREEFLDIVDELSERCFVPLAVGGWITSIPEIETLLEHGADKITVNTHAFRNPAFVTEAAKVFGSQCVVVSIDVKRDADGAPIVWIDRGQESTGVTAVEWAKRAVDAGAGEILLTSIDHDGMRKGYDLPLMKSVSAPSACR